MSASDGDGSSKKSNNILFYHPSKHAILFAKQYRTELSAGAASLLSTFGGFPLDLTKSRMQSYNTTFLATIKDAYHQEGLRSFWRGVGPPLASILFVRTASMSIYQKAKYAYDRIIHDLTGDSPLVTANAPSAYPNIGTVLCFGAAGATAGAAVTVLSCPFELTKLNEQLAGKEARNKDNSGQFGSAAQNNYGGKKSGGAIKNYFKTGSFATAKRLVAARGWKGLYTGYSLHLARDTIGTAVYFATYESVKQLIGNARGNSAVSPLAVLAAGGTCGILSWVCVYPFDVAKTLRQKAALSTPKGQDPVRVKVNYFGCSYRGLGVSLIRTCIINMIFFSTFETSKKRINALDVDLD